MPRAEWAVWTDEHDEVLCRMRSDFPVETFSGIAKVLTVMFGIKRTRDACIARWHRIETEDTAIVRKVLVQAEFREARKNERLYRPETPWEAQLPPTPPLPDTPSLPMLRASHAPPKVLKPPYKDTPEAIRKRRERAAQRPPPCPARHPLVMRVPTLAELDLHRASMR